MPDDSLIFNYTVPIMLSEQQAGWGVKTGYFFAGTAGLGGIGLYFLMPEVRPGNVGVCLLTPS